MTVKATMTKTRSWRTSVVSGAFSWISADPQCGQVSGFAGIGLRQLGQVGISLCQLVDSVLLLVIVAYGGPRLCALDPNASRR